MGRIGRKVAEFAHLLGMKVIYHNLHRVSEEVENELDAEFVDFDTLLAESDFLTLNAPATKETKKIIDTAALKKMKDTAYLINT